MGDTVMEISKDELNVSIRAVKDYRQKSTEIETLASFRVPAEAPKIEIKSS